MERICTEESAVNYRREIVVTIAIAIAMCFSLPSLLQRAMTIRMSIPSIRGRVFGASIESIPSRRGALAASRDGKDSTNRLSRIPPDRLIDH
jgi:hypothetical protein